MIRLDIGKIKIQQLSGQMLLLAFAGLFIFTSCEKKETITDVYFIHNDLEKPVSLEFIYPLIWDTCSAMNADSYSQVWYEEQTLVIPAHTTIRLHPVCRTYGNPLTHEIDPIPIIASTTKLILGEDTITWQAEEQKRLPMVVYCMFSSDEVWSIYNTESWQTIPDHVIPYVYYNTFSITQEAIEKSQVL